MISLLVGSSPRFGVGVEVGILGYELFLKETVSNKKNQTPGWDFQTSQVGLDFQNVSYLNRISGKSMFVGLKDKNKREQVVWDLDIQLTTGKETGLRPFYLGKNNYIGYETSKFLFGVGRREHKFRPMSFQTSFDGGDGVFLEFQPQSNLTLQFFLWDQYSGSLLFQKDRFHSLLAHSPKEKSDHWEELESKEDKQSHHRRHSFGFVYGNDLNLRLGIQYIELGSWGRHVKDSPRETKSSGADGDSIINGNVGFGWDLYFVDVQFDFLWAKGNDRSNSKITNSPGSIPISGEAIQWGAELQFGGFLFRSSHFLSDREERNSKNQIIREGYVSLGSHPGQTPYISQIFRIFPSAAVTDTGYDKNFALIDGKCFGYLTELVLQFTYRKFVGKFVGNYFLPYKVGGSSDGRISFQKRDFEVFSIAEGLLELSLKEDSSFELGIGFSQVILPESIGIKSNFGYVFGRLEL
ncbi:LA_2168 family protein [Leptospira bandrabouensis]|uniref:LA_2168 family protein n=1 Tax=Leptospira bandrabouensis TaxID=2484903 RepID=UPI001EE93EC4|nr:hypothetical protein [Leptospira bandrabouensis]MCG6145007.1 hypothetical protein [Leptospira bandrabouensis]MCG6160356.1 hypothetical protein [Leptospira bandrabouensis]